MLPLEENYHLVKKKKRWRRRTANTKHSNYLVTMLTKFIWQQCDTERLISHWNTRGRYFKRNLMKLASLIRSISWLQTTSDWTQAAPQRCFSLHTHTHSYISLPQRGAVATINCWHDWILYTEQRSCLSLLSVKWHHRVGRFSQLTSVSRTWWRPRWLEQLRFGKKKKK